MSKPSFEKRKAGIDQQKQAIKDGMTKNGVSPREADRVATERTDRAIRKLQEEQDW